MPTLAKDSIVKPQTGTVPNTKEVGVKIPLRTGSCAKVVEELPEPTKRRYKVLDYCCQVLSEPNLHGKLMGHRQPGEEVDGVEVSMNGWLKLADEGGWMPTSFRCWASTEALPEGNSELMEPVEGPAGERGELVVEGHQPQGLACLEVVFKSVLVRKLPNRQSLPLGVCKQGEYVFASSQNFEGWVRLEGQEGWMLAWAEEHGELLRPRPWEDVVHVDLWALSEVWVAMRKAAFPIKSQMVTALKDLEQRAAAMANSNPKLREHELQQLRMELRQREELCRAEALCASANEEEDQPVDSPRSRRRLPIQSESRTETRSETECETRSETECGGESVEEDAEFIEEDDGPEEGDAFQLDGEDGQMLQQLLQQRLFVRSAVRLLREEPFKDLAPDFALYMCLPSVDMVHHDDEAPMETVVYDSVTGEPIGLWNEEAPPEVPSPAGQDDVEAVVVYDSITGETIGLWNEETQEVVSLGGNRNIIQVGDQMCILDPNHAVYDLHTKELLGVYYPDANEVVKEVGQSTGKKLLELECHSSDGSESNTANSSGRRALAMVPHGVDAVATAPGKGLASSSTSPVAQDKFDPDATRRLEEAMALGAQCVAAERDGPSHWLESVWEEVMKLRPVLALAVQPEFELPPQFQHAMSTLATCLLHAPEGQLQCAGRLVDLLEFQDLGSILHYFDWLEAAMRELSLASRPCCSPALVPGRVQSALQSWSTECARFQRSAADLWEAVLRHAPEYLSNAAEQRRISEAQQDLQAAQVKVSVSIAQELKAATSGFAEQLRIEQGSEWPALARMTEDALASVQNLTSRLLMCNEGGWARSADEHEALNRQASVGDAAMSSARRQVQRHTQAFRQSVDCFAEFGGQIVAWLRALVPKLRLLGEHRGALRTAAELKSRLPRLECQKIEAEDQLDAVVMQLRRHRRHVQGSWKTRSNATPTTGDDSEIEKQLELHRARLEEHVRHLSASLREAELTFAAASAELPLTIDPKWRDEVDEAGSATGQSEAKLAVAQVAQAAENADADSSLIDAK